MVLRDGPARPDAGTARSASAHRAAVPGHRMPACHRAIQAARNHLPGHGPRMRRHPGSERNPRSSHPAGSRFGLAAGPSGVSAGPPVYWTPSGHPGVKSRPSPPTCQWTDGCADRPGRQMPGTGQPPTSDDMMADCSPQEEQDVPVWGGPPGPAGTTTPERAAPKTPGPSPAGTRATGHAGRAGASGRCRRAGQAKAANPHGRSPPPYSMKCRRMAGMKGPARVTLKNGRPPQAEIARTIVEPGGGPHVLAPALRTRAADHNTPGRPIVVTGIWKRAGGGTRGRAKKKRSPGGFKAGGDADPQDHKDREIYSRKRLGGDRRARADAGCRMASSGAAPPRPTVRRTPEATPPMPYHPVAATAPIRRNTAGGIPAARGGLWASTATTSAPHPFCQNPPVRAHRRPPGQPHGKKNGVSCRPYRRWPAHR